MSKKKSPLKKRTQNKRQLIDHIPCCWRKPRTEVSPRRRTDFSSISLLKNPSGKGLLRVSLNRVDRLTTHTGMGNRRDSIQEHTMFSLSACNSSRDTKGRLFSDGVESNGQNSLLEASSGRNFDKPNADGMGNSELFLEKSQVTGNTRGFVATGNVIWAKTASQHWWPAEVMGDESTVVDSQNEGIDGNILIRYYGTHENVGLDPAKHLSEFDECFEERSSNPTDEFQDALKQALHQREHQSLSKQFSELSRDYSGLNHGYQTPDKWHSSSSSRTESPCDEIRQGKRERKRKLHFDEEPLRLIFARGVRRTRIMRSLGLAAPVGSPFEILACKRPFEFCD